MYLILLMDSAAQANLVCDHEGQPFELEAEAQAIANEFEARGVYTATVLKPQPVNLGLLRAPKPAQISYAVFGKKGIV